MKTFSYDPARINDGGIDQMRFELGDAEVEGKDETCALCDEEYNAMIQRALNENKAWKWAIFYCLSAIKMKYSHEVTYSSGGMSLSLAERYKNYKEMYDKMEKELKSSMQVPSASNQSLGDGSTDGGHYFYLGMGNNPRTGN